MRCGRFYTDVVAAGTMNFPAGDMQKEKATQDAARRQRRQKETLENSANEKSARKLKSTKTAEHTAPSHRPPSSLPLPLSLAQTPPLRCRDKPKLKGKPFFNCFAAAAASDDGSGSAACARIALELCCVSQKASRHDDLTPCPKPRAALVSWQPSASARLRHCVCLRLCSSRAFVWRSFCARRAFILLPDATRHISPALSTSGMLR